MGDHQEELQTPPEFSSDPPDFSALHLHTSPCSSCGRSPASADAKSRKRSSPGSAPTTAKKLFLDHSPENHHHGLARSTSDPEPLRPPFPAPSPESAGLPPRPPTLRRAGSDPIPSPSKTLSMTSSSASDMTDTAPNSKADKILNRWREMSVWIEDLIRDENSKPENPTTATTEDPNGENPDDNADTENFKFNSNKRNCSPEFEEALSIEKDGERLNIHFKCHCGKLYDFLLADGNCFYKLM